MVSAKQGIKAAKEIQKLAASLAEQADAYLRILDAREAALRDSSEAGSHPNNGRLSIAARAKLARQALGYGNNA